MSGFVSLRSALSGLYAAQAGLDTASHNVANAGNPAYTRQRVHTVSRAAAATPYGSAGTGVDVVAITRTRNAFLDGRLRSSLAGEGRLETLVGLLDGVEAALAEPNAGVTAALSNLWAAFEDLALDPTDPSARLAVLASLDSVASRFRTIAGAWDASATYAATQMSSSIAEVNGLLDEVARLNTQIGSISSGGPPNDLLDARDRALDRLATLAGVTVTITADGAARVSLDGLALVHDARTSHLSFDPSTGDVSHASGATVRPGGAIGGAHDFLTNELPELRTRLEALVTEFATALNTQHAAGFTSAGAAGGALFTFTPGAAAATLALTVTNPADIAAAASGPPVADYDAGNAQALAGLRNALAAGGGSQTLEGATRAVVTWVGQTLATVDTALASQLTVTAAAQHARNQAHGVGIDEEMVDLITFQRAYEAAARVMTTVDQALDTLINRTGVVGR